MGARRTLVVFTTCSLCILLVVIFAKITGASQLAYLPTQTDSSSTNTSGATEVPTDIPLESGDAKISVCLFRNYDATNFRCLSSDNAVGPMDENNTYLTWGDENHTSVDKAWGLTSIAVYTVDGTGSMVDIGHADIGSATLSSDMNLNTNGRVSIKLSDLFLAFSVNTTCGQTYSIRIGSSMYVGSSSHIFGSQSLTITC